VKHIFSPLTFPNITIIVTPKVKQYFCIPVANAIIHPVSGASMKYHQLIQDEATSKAWLRAAANLVLNVPIAHG
jgi:hypothetical protein